MTSEIIKQKQTFNKYCIIVLCMNNVKVTIKFLDCLYKNTTNFDLVMIDNGSIDSTREFLKNYFFDKENATCVFNEENNGVILGRNQGWDIISKEKNLPEIVGFLDNDQFVQPEWAYSHLSFLDKYDMVGVEAWQMSRDFLPIKKISRLNDWFCYVGCGGMFLKTKVIQDIGLFDPQFSPSYFEDPDINFRAYDKGYKIGWNFNSKIHHLPHQTLGFRKDKNQLFLNSHDKFRKKWGKRLLPRIFQF